MGASSSCWARRWSMCVGTAIPWAWSCSISMTSNPSTMSTVALILPHTDLEGTYVIAERTRQAIEALRIPFLDRAGALQIPASLGAAASVDGHKDELISAADNALYVAKREGKNRTVKADSQTANV